MVTLPQRERSGEMPRYLLGVSFTRGAVETPMEEWKTEEITAHLDGAVGKGAVGEYRLQAAIAAPHDQAHTADDTDWRQILALYGLLEQLTRNPVVTLNKAVAAAMANGPTAGLALLDTVDERLAGHYRLEAVRAHLLEMAGEMEAALEHYRVAASRTTSLPEKRYLAMRSARLKAEAVRAQ